MRSSQETAITVLDIYDMYAGDKNDAGVDLGRLGRLLCSYEFRFSVSTWNLFEIAVRDSDVHILARKYGARNVRCTLRMRFWASYISSFKTLLFSILGYIMLSFGSIWVSVGVVRQPTSNPMGTRETFPIVKRPGLEADHSPPSSVVVKNAWSYTSTPQYVFMAWCLVKGNIT
jgi:hypothetical protein